MLFDGISVEEFAEIRAQEAYDIGRESGLAKGRAEEKLKIAKNLKDAALPVDLIAKSTGLTIAEVEAL